MRRHRSSVLLVALALAGSTADASAGPDVGQTHVQQRPSPEISATSDAENRRITVTWTDASLANALRDLVRVGGLGVLYSSTILPMDRRVSMTLNDVPAEEALVRLLATAGLGARKTRSGQYVIVHASSRAPAVDGDDVDGTITGRVTDASSGVGLAGVVVVLDGAGFGATTGNTGRFRINGVLAGTYTLLAQQIGYAEARLPVTVTEGREVVLDVALEVSAVALDEVVVTGTAFETRRRTVPNPISVITAADIEQKNAANVTDLLRGEIPGVMPLSFGSQDYQTFIYVRGNAAWNGGGGGDYIKIYIDGVEVARPWALSTIDPKSIERIEVVRGPQAATIYGSEAASGVLQIFTKKGASQGLDRPRLDARASVALHEGEYVPDGTTPISQDYGLEASGGSDSFSYRVGASHSRGAEWIRGYSSETLNFSGGLRALHGPFTAEITVLWSDREQSSGAIPIYWRYDMSDVCPECGRPDYTSKTINMLGQNTMGLSLTYLATSRWQHTLTLGDDQNRFGYHDPAPSLLTPADTFVTLSLNEQRRRSISYKTAYNASLGGTFDGRVTAGVDYWRFETQGGGASDLLSALPVQTSPATTTTLENDQWSNLGYFGMLELGFREQLYLTLAARVEDNDRLGEEYGRAVSPRAGVSYVRNVGPTEVKLRAQYGKGIRPPPGIARAGRTSEFVITLPNPRIGPEEKVGWDAGVELFWGRRASLAVTRYDEEGRDLIMPVDIDPASVPRTQQYLNVGRVSSTGWEVEATVNAGPFSLEANYAYTDNVIRELSNAYPEGPNQTFQVGDRMLRTPKHSAGAKLTGRFLRGSASLDMSLMHDQRELDYNAYYDYLLGGVAYRGSLRDYYVEYSHAPKWNVTVDQTITDRLGAFFRVENLTNDSDTDISNFYVSSGRRTAFGMRFTY